jgi:hypothetical protein
MDEPHKSYLSIKGIPYFNCYPKCSISSCKFRSRNFGLCYKHKIYALRCSNPNFLKDREEYHDLALKYAKESSNLISQGYNINEIKKYWIDDLTFLRLQAFPPHYKVLGELLEQLSDKENEMYTKYDRYLVYNNCKVISHSYLYKNCTCKLCRLSKPKSSE